MGEPKSSRPKHSTVNMSATASSAAAAAEQLLDFKIGQRKVTPPPGAGDRVFYESLYRQRPSSFMALKWCVEYGVLDESEVKAAVALLEKRKAELKQGLTGSSAAKSSSSSQPPKKKKKVKAVILE